LFIQKISNYQPKKNHLEISNAPKTKINGQAKKNLIKSEKRLISRLFVSKKILQYLNFIIKNVLIYLRANFDGAVWKISRMQKGLD
jgi:hypothetical protein